MREEPILKVDKISVRFGEFWALKEVSVEVRPKELVALIGPNGAGKTTFYNAVTGRYKPCSGKVFFNGEEITGMAPHLISRKGLGRSFQITNIFLENTVEENILAALVSKHKKGLSMLRPLSSYRELIDEAHGILEMLGIAHKAGEEARFLAYGDKRLVEIGIALATEPRMILLDEPTAGMTPDETERMVQMIRRLDAETPVTFFLTEHDMKVVFSISQRILVLHQGEVLAVGTPQEISGNPAVKEAYLGGSLDA